MKKKIVITYVSESIVNEKGQDYQNPNIPHFPLPAKNTDFSRLLLLLLNHITIDC